MTPSINLIYGVVLAAAVLHATWNAVVKGSSDTLLSAVGVAGFAALIAAVSLPWLPQPSLASWPWILASSVLQLLYMRLVAHIYHVADMSITYPVMRGTAPLLVAAVSLVLFHDHLSRGALLGIAVICTGILCIGLRLPGHGRPPRGLGLALLNAVVIASYTLVDGAGVRLSGAPLAYTLWIFLLLGLAMLAMAQRSHPDRLWPYLRAHWRAGMIGGFGTIASYAAALWAMTYAPIAVIAALRETSILFGTLISGLILHERVTTRRIVGSCILVAGAILLRLA